MEKSPRVTADKVLRTADSGHRKPAQPHREDHDQQQAQPEDGQRLAHQPSNHEHVVPETAAAQSRHDPKRQPQAEGDGHGSARELQGVGQPLHHQGEGRLLLPKGHAKVPLHGFE